MSGRLTKFKITPVNNKCFNTFCDARMYCGHYSSTPTSEESSTFIKVSCEFCDYFKDNREYVLDTEPKLLKTY